MGREKKRVPNLKFLLEFRFDSEYPKIINLMLMVLKFYLERTFCIRNSSLSMAAVRTTSKRLPTFIG